VLVVYVQKNIFFVKKDCGRVLDSSENSAESELKWLVMRNFVNAKCSKVIFQQFLCYISASFLGLDSAGKGEKCVPIPG
jgi:hypothetical protein